MSRMSCLVSSALMAIALSSTRVGALPYEPDWEDVDGLSAKRAIETHVIPLEDGRALVVGGSEDTGDWDLFDAATEAWVGSVTPIDARVVYHFATRLADGRVLVGGGAVESVILAAVEIFDPETDTSSAAEPLPFGLWTARAVTLNDGRVLVVGGQTVVNGSNAGFSDTLIYRPDSDTWVTGPPLGIRRVSPYVTLLEDGRVLIAGGVDGGSNVLTTYAEIFVPGVDGGADTVVPTANAMPHTRYHSISGRLGDGRVIFAGGIDDADGMSADVFDPADDTWYPLPAMETGRLWAAGSDLYDGSFLVAGGVPSPDIGTAGLATVERFDPESEDWVPMKPLPEGRMGAVAARVDDVLLVVGGGEGFGSDFHDDSVMLSFKNVAPVAVASVAEYTVPGIPGYATAVVLSAEGSYDDDEGDVLTYTWTEGASTLAVTLDPVQEVTVGLAVGTHTITLTITDRYGEIGTDEITVEVVNAGGLLQEQLDQCLEAKDSLEGQLATANTTITSLEVDLAEANTEITSLEGQLTTANTTITSLEGQLTTANTTITSLEGQLTTANTTITSLQSQLTQANEDKAALQSQLDAAAAANASLQDELDAAAAANTSLQSQLDAAAAVNASLQSQLAAAAAVNASLQDELAAALAELGGVEAERDQCLLDQAEAEAERDQCLDDAAALAAEIEALEALLETCDDGDATAAYVVKRVQALLRDKLRRPGFVIPGETPKAQLEALLAALERAPPGLLQNLYLELVRPDRGGHGGNESR